jgi:hypothetical protein
MLQTGTFTSSESGSINLLQIETVHLSKLSSFGNSSSATFETLYTEAQDSFTIYTSQENISKTSF